ncbi:MAG TPA: hypothetical protein DEB21_20520, partial [Rhodospirillaceae bacterium]|nr:hypothetical protein [Rhodospirillaceae bacterium]
MTYVQRGAGGAIVGFFANMQPGIAEEFLADDDPEMVALAAAQADAEVIEAIRDHAEALIRDGITLEGSPFRGDGNSRARLAESIDGLTRGVISTAKFTTAAGVPFEVSDAAILASLRDVFIAYGAAVLAASTDLQLIPPASAGDVPGNAA